METKDTKLLVKPCLDTLEFEMPETTFIRDIENRVFQALVFQCLSKIKGVTLAEGTFIDNILGRAPHERFKGVHVEQDSKNHSVSIRVEVMVQYGVHIPDKAEEVQNNITAEVSRLTGLHVGAVHVVFKGVLLPESAAERELCDTLEPEALEGDKAGQRA